MTKYDEEIDGCKSICPYCGNGFQVEAEDYDESGTVIECDHCLKQYHYYTTFDVTHHARPDCTLNNAEHEWESRISERNGIAYELCMICGAMDFSINNER